MDYEKEYKEALKRAKEIAVFPTDRAMIEHIFPELADSEEERIRKWIVNLVMETDKNHSNPKLSENVKSALAYLEKQKEQKPGEWSEEDEAMMNNILRVLSCFVGSAECESNTALSTSYPLYVKEIAWLKSLRARIKKED